MKQRSILWQAAGFAVATLGGTIAHFLYDWTGGSILVSPFSGVNESTCEHMKLMFFSMLLLTGILMPKWRETYENVELILNLVLKLILILFQNNLHSAVSSKAIL